MLLASAPRSIRARWLGVSTLALIVAVAAPPAGHAQDGTVYIGGGSNSPDGPRGVQGGDNVIVNMDAVDGGRGRAGQSSLGRSSSGRSGSGDRSSVDFGDTYRGPAGAILRFPPERPPESHLTVDPGEMSTSRQANRDTGSSEPTPARKPERQPPQQRQETPSAAPDSEPQAPAEPSEQTQTVEVPDAPDLQDGGARQAGTPDSGRPTAETGQSGAVAPTALTARPARKPESPQPSRTTETDTAAASDHGAQAADVQDSTSEDTSASPGTETDSAAPSVPDAAPDEETQTADTTPAEPADTRTSGADSTAGEAAESGGQAQTQTAALPPEGLPEQMRLMFGDDSATLNDSAKQQLDRLADVLQDNPRQRVQLMAFAQGTEDTASQARRLSLSRALAVRTYLIDKGIRSTRMDVRALGATAEQTPMDRVDIVPANR